MRFLVTGGAGFIGSHVVDQLLAAEHEVVTIFDKTMPGNLEHVQDQVNWIHGDIRDMDFCFKACRDVDAIIHLAALINVDHSIESPSVFYDVNTQGTMNLLEASRVNNKRLKKFVMMSTFEVYGQTLTERAKENFTFCDPRSPYAASKYAAERYCLSYASSYPEPEITVIRGANVFGPRQSNTAKGAAIAIFITKLLRGEAVTLFGTGEQTRDYVYVKDTARGIIKAATTTGLHGEIINLCSGSDTKMLDIVSMIGCRLNPGQPTKIQYAEARPGENIRSCGNPTKAANMLDWYVPESNIIGMNLDETIDYYKGQA